ncbi:alternate F1F0 ATPase, F1 subunit alpha [Halomonas nitroreducens]|uniref:ATP synthase subunit alpha n=1 Tax=Halomonas nitroreducens TaxID=447425 RepID=A0A431V8H6_9GAMM|nr:alternate F1F0 ATPase, F1 subunit alpha [Halomonas nitroreducens]RTR06983.1 alternate F1F0 ATPase, F1 subunit alpha [Halomonas nitroreducens]
MLERLLDDTLDRLEAAIGRVSPALELQEVGTVVEVGGGIARLEGLPGVTAEELVAFDGGGLGIVFNLAPDAIEVMLLDDRPELSAGSRARATGREVDTPVGEALLGRVLDATGRVLDGGDPLGTLERWPVERPAPAILDRAPVTVPLETGIKAIDALIPIGRGQRELIIGDRQTGKTSVAIDAILNQRDKGVICLYCAVGQRGTAVSRVVDTLRDQQALPNTIVLVASDADAPGLRFITPYAAMTMAEYFMARGRDVLVVLDDLTRHARAYRELSLLARRPPGREAFPGDIFYIHSRLLERSTQLVERLGGGSLTALPIIETQGQDMSAYIPTNLISITDGQVYLSPSLFHKGFLPAIEVGRSVSRVGGKTQYPAFRQVAGDLRLAYAQFEELETFSRFATRLDAATRQAIEHGRRVREVLKQPEHRPFSAGEQLVVLKAVNEGLLDGLPLEQIAAAETRLTRGAQQRLPALCAQLDSGEPLEEAQWQQLLEAARAVLGEAAGAAKGGPDGIAGETAGTARDAG